MSVNIIYNFFFIIHVLINIYGFMLFLIFIFFHYPLQSSNESLFSSARTNILYISDLFNGFGLNLSIYLKQTFQNWLYYINKIIYIYFMSNIKHSNFTIITGYLLLTLCTFIISRTNDRTLCYISCTNINKRNDALLSCTYIE